MRGPSKVYPLRDFTPRILGDPIPVHDKANGTKEKPYRLVGPCTPGDFYRSPSGVLYQKMPDGGWYNCASETMVNHPSPPPPPDPIDVVVDERGKKYGPPEVNHQTTAEFFYIYLMRVGDRRINRRDVAMLNILQKISRDLYSPEPDNLVDIKGYATNAERMAEKEET